MPGGTYLLLGGAGLVGFQVAYRIGVELGPERIVVVSRTERSMERALSDLRELLDDVELVGEWGDVFVREAYARRSRDELLAEPVTREGVFEDILGPFERAYERSHLTTLIRRYRPEVVIDAINTATAISYQDVYASSVIAKQHVDAIEGGAEPAVELLAGSVETLILSQAVPQLIRHVRVLKRALDEVGTRLYLKIGTTGTGGMGLEIPFTHSEDRPSAKLMTKTAVAFAHTGLLFLMSRTEGGPLVKEIKPAALIGFADVDRRPIRQQGEPVRRYRAHREPLADRLRLRLDPAGLDLIGDLVLPVVDTGENGVFTKGEFETITSLGQMEMVTPEEIAATCIQEIRGGATGLDVLSGLDASVMGPSYRGGVVRSWALDELNRLEDESGSHSVALGQLGPPELSKLLWEAELLRLAFGTVTAVLTATSEAMAAAWESVVQERPDILDTITSLGLPVLSSDGRTLARGPFIRIPEIAGSEEVDLDPAAVDRWADKGWIDLRPANAVRWRERFRSMREARLGTAQPGSAGITATSYLPDQIEIGTIAAWVLANEHGGLRIK
jgi:hypothetical protein